MKIFLLLTLLLITNTYSQVNNIDISQQKNDCKNKLSESLNGIKAVLDNYNAILTTGDTARAINILNTSIGDKINPISEITDICLQSISASIDFQFESIKTQYESISQTLAECNKRNNNEVANVLLSRLKELFDKLEQKERDLNNRDIRIEKLSKDSLALSNNIKNLTETARVKSLVIDSLKKEIEKKDIAIEIYREQKSLFNIGLAFGVNIDSKGDYNYLVNPDSTIQEKQVGVGGNGMVSAVASFEFLLPFIQSFSKNLFGWNDETKNNRPLPGYFKILLNIPLTETLYQDKENAIGLFNKKIALGIGVGLDLLRLGNGNQSLSIFYIINFSSVRKLQTEYYKDYKFSEGYPNKINLDNYVTITEPNTTHFIGLYLALF